MSAETPTQRKPGTFDKERARLAGLRSAQRRAELRALEEQARASGDAAPTVLPAPEQPEQNDAGDARQRLILKGLDAVDTLNPADMRDNDRLALIRSALLEAARGGTTVTPDSLIRTAYSDVPTCPHCKLPLV